MLRRKDWTSQNSNFTKRNLLGFKNSRLNLSSNFSRTSHKLCKNSPRKNPSQNRPAASLLQGKNKIIIKYNYKNSSYQLEHVDWVGSE